MGWIRWKGICDLLRSGSMTSRVAGRTRSARLVPLVAFGLVVTLTPIVTGPLAAHTLFSTQQSRAGSQEQPTDLDVQATADQLLTLVTPSKKENSYYPAFAKEKIDWVNAEAKAGKLSILLVNDISGTSMDAGTLMASGVIKGKRTIVIVQPRFKRLLLEEGGVRGPFTQRQKNNFMLGLVHEAVHLANPGA